jgi:hypothetical protein
MPKRTITQHIEINSKNMASHDFESPVWSNRDSEIIQDSRTLEVKNHHCKQCIAHKQTRRFDILLSKTIDEKMSGYTAGDCQSQACVHSRNDRNAYVGFPNSSCSKSLLFRRPPLLRLFTIHCRVALMLK